MFSRGSLRPILGFDFADNSLVTFGARLAAAWRAGALLEFDRITHPLAEGSRPVSKGSPVAAIVIEEFFGLAYRIDSWCDLLALLQQFFSQKFREGRCVCVYAFRSLRLRPFPRTPFPRRRTHTHNLPQC